MGSEQWFRLGALGRCCVVLLVVLLVPLAQDEPAALVVEEVYDIRLNESAIDPSYKAGVREIFVNDVGISVFTNSSFIRTNLDGEILTSVPYHQASLGKVQQIDKGYAAVFRHIDGPMFCQFGDEGPPLDIGACTPVLTDDFAWVSPYFYFLGVGRDSSPEYLLGYFSILVLDEAGQLVEDRNIEHADSSDSQFTISIHGLKDQLVVTTLRLDEYFCRVPMFASVTTFDTNEPLKMGPFVRPFEIGYKQTYPYRETVGHNSVAMRLIPEPCERASSVCEPTERIPIITIFDGNDFKVQPTAASIPHAVASGYAHVSFSDEELRRYRFSLLDKDGLPKETATWPMAAFVTTTGAPRVAEIAPRDYVLAFSVTGLRPQERLVRFRLSSAEPAP